MEVNILFIYRENKNVSIYDGAFLYTCKICFSGKYSIKEQNGSGSTKIWIRIRLGRLHFGPDTDQYHKIFFLREVMTLVLNTYTGGDRCCCVFFMILKAVLYIILTCCKIINPRPNDPPPPMEEPYRKKRLTLSCKLK